MQIDKRAGTLCFNEESHKYWNEETDTPYISVTTLIESYGQPFDKEFWSAYKALEKLMDSDVWKLEKKNLLSAKKFNKELLDLYNITESEFNKAQQDILDEWEQKNRESCERGTKIHARLEEAVLGHKKEFSLTKFGVGGKFICKGRDYHELNLEAGAYPEYMIGREVDPGLFGLSGQIDLLLKKGNSIIICDYKGLPLDTELLSKNGWTTIGNVKEGDIIYDKNGKETTIIHKSSIHYNPCYKITFDNNDEIVADEDHRWEISFKVNKSKCHPDGFNTCVMTTKELFEYLNKIEKRTSYNIPKIMNPDPIQGDIKELLIDPYVLGAWLGDGSKDCGIITQAANSPLWEEIRKRGYEIGENAQHSPDREGTEMRTVYGLRVLLRKYGILNNKNIPEEYYTASFSQRLDLLRGFMDTDGYYHPKRKRFVMATGQEWQRDCLVKLLGTLGIKPTVFYVKKKCGDKYFDGWDICFSTNGLNPFLIRNQNIEFPSKDANSFRNIDKIEMVDSIPTQCLEVDSPTHTFLCTNKCIVTHNTNAEIKTKSYYDSKTRTSQKMLYPLNRLDDTNYWHYNLQLSTYAWMIQQYHPEFDVEDLILIHFRPDGKQDIYHLEYLKDEVEAMIKHHHKKLLHEKKMQKYNKIEY